MGAWFAKLCREHGVHIIDRLPWGTMAKPRGEQGGAGGGLTDRQLIRFARGYARDGFAIASITSNAGRVRTERRRRLVGGGRRHKAPYFRELLFEWLCSVRGAIATRLPIAALKAQAQVMREQFMQAAVKRHTTVKVPMITNPWISGWMRQHQVSLRTPNRRWKLSHQVCLERCRITWLNIYRVRRLCELEHGYDPEMDGFDQKPFHV